MLRGGAVSRSMSHQRSSPHWLLGVAFWCSCSATPEMVSSPTHDLPDAAADTGSPGAADAGDPIDPHPDAAGADAGPNNGAGATERRRIAVPDCNGGTVLLPYWVSEVAFQAALCVHAPAAGAVQVDFGTSLIGAEEAAGTDVKKHQVYYSLSRAHVLPMQRQVVWAVCGGDGAPLPSGSRVIPAGRLPAMEAQRLAERVTMLEAYEANLSQFEKLLANPASQSTNGGFLSSQIAGLENAIDVEARVLRAAIMTENEKLLQKKNLKMALPPVSFY